jgi:hypothetical protein
MTWSISFATISWSLLGYMRIERLISGRLTPDGVVEGYRASSLIRCQAYFLEVAVLAMGVADGALTRVRATEDRHLDVAVFNLALDAPIPVHHPIPEDLGAQVIVHHPDTLRLLRFDIMHVLCPAVIGVLGGCGHRSVHAPMATGGSAVGFRPATAFTISRDCSRTRCSGIA